MKKIFSILATAVLAFGFTACEDVPAPYGINADGSGSTPATPTPDGTIINESFASSMGKFTTATPTGNYPWAISYGSAQITSYVDADGDGEKENNPAESWLISPKMDLTNVEAAYVSFDYILRYATASQVKTHYQLLVSKNYAGNVTEANWTALDINLEQSSDWDTWKNVGKVSIPEEFCKNPDVTVALCYKATTKAATWEVKNFKVQEGAGDDNTGGETPDYDAEKSLPYSEAFSTTFGAFKNYTTSGSGEWIIDFSTAKATGYDGTTKITTAGTYYLVSPKISLAGQTEAHISYEYILRYLAGQENQQILICENFDEANPTAGWTLLNGTHTEGTDWNTFAKADVQIPAEFMGKTVRVAFRYNTNAVSGSTWEVRNFTVQSGTAGDDDSGNSGGDIVGETGTNGGFEEWANDAQPVNWKSASSASSATLAKSNDAHSGSYSVCVKNGTTQNKRISYREIPVAAGTYTITFYAKAATAEGGSLAAGFVPVTDGKVGTYVYAQNAEGKTDYLNDLPNTEWVKVTRTVEIPNSGEVCFIIMNSKSPGKDILIDDFSVTNAAGEYIIK